MAEPKFLPTPMVEVSHSENDPMSGPKKALIEYTRQWCGLNPPSEILIRATPDPRVYIRCGPGPGILDVLDFASVAEFSDLGTE